MLQEVGQQMPTNALQAAARPTAASAAALTAAGAAAAIEMRVKLRQPDHGATPTPFRLPSKHARPAMLSMRGRYIPADTSRMLVTSNVPAMSKSVI